MTSVAETALASIQLVQLLLSSFEANLAFGSHWCPTDSSIDTITSTTFDYIIVGGGTAGSILANRLSGCTNKNILLLEAGGCPPLESLCTGYFTFLPESAYDYNMTSVDDGYACQGLKGKSVGTTVGKMWGGSNSIHHGIWVRGAAADYDSWVAATNDFSWSYDSLTPYFMKAENVHDTDIIKENGTTTGNSGPIVLKRQVSSENDVVFEGFVELGYPKLNNINNYDTVQGITTPLLQIDTASGMRQGGHVSYLYPAKTRSNLYVLSGATVSRVNFDSDNVATGVTFTYSDATYTVNAASEVILSAGAIKTPQLLMLSGVGPSSHLTDKNIPCISDLPVGQNLQDHAGATLLFAVETDTSAAAAANPFDFPVPATTSYINLSNSTGSQAEYQDIALVFPGSSAGLLQLCTNVFKYNNTICDAMYAANIGRKVLWNVCDALHPTSSGEILLRTTSIDDQPLIYLNLLSDKAELEGLASYLSHVAELVNTTSFKSVGAQVVDLGLCSEKVLYSTEYWQCYALAMSSTMWHYSGTAAMGSVVDTNLLVKGVSNLRVVDASVFPTVPGGNINAAVVAVAEKIADVITSGINCSA